VKLYALALAGVVALAGCGGSPNTPDGSTVGSGGGPIPPPAQFVAAGVVIQVPLAKKKPRRERPDYISVNTRSVTVALASVNGNGVGGVNATTINTYPGAPNCGTSPGMLTCTGKTQAQGGEDVFTVTTYAGPNATGAILSAGSVSQSIGSGGGRVTISNGLSLAVGGVIAALRLKVSPSSVPRGTRASVPITLTALDASGAQIVGRSMFDVPISMSIQGDSVGAFSLHSDEGNGASLTLVRPPARLTLAYDGNVQAANISVQASVQGTQTSATAAFAVKGAPPPPPIGTIYALSAGSNYGKGASVTVYDGKANGNAAPLRTLRLDASLYARSIAVDASGNLFVGYLDNSLGFSPATGTPDTGNEVAIYAPTASGSAQPTSVIKSNTANGTALFPIALAFDAAGDLVTFGATTVDGNTGNAVLVYAPKSSGAATPAHAWSFASPQISYAGPTGLALDAGGNFYVNGALKTSLGPSYGVFVNAAANVGNPSASPSRTIPWDTKTQLTPGEVANAGVDASGEIFVGNFALVRSGGSSSCQAQVNVYAAGSTGGTTDVAPLRTLKLNGVSTTNPNCFSPNNPIAAHYPTIAPYGTSVFVADEFGNAIDAFPSSGRGGVAASKHIAGSATGLATPIGVYVTSQAPPASDTASSVAQVRFVEGAPVLETNFGGVPIGLGTPFLTVDGTTIASAFGYGQLTQFQPYAAGKIVLDVRDSLGYTVGPFTTPALSAGQSYSVVLVGTYPKYSLLTFADPKNSSGATLAVYEASPGMPSADFGSFHASTHSVYRKLGSVHLGSVADVSLGSRVRNFGAYVGKGTSPITGGSLTLRSVDSFDAANALPFHSASRISLFVLDPLAGSTFGPVFGIFDE
jgi:hypothetical protein